MPAATKQASYQENDIMIATVLKSSVIPLPIGTVWPLLRDFNGLPQWHPAVVESFIEQDLPADTVGCIRNYGRRDNLRLREQLLRLDDDIHLCTYSLLDPPIPVSGYTATLRAFDVTDAGHTFVEWSARFDCSARDEAELTASIGEVFSNGLLALKKPR